MATETIGQRMTAQRRLLLDIIRSANEHLDADGLYRQAKERDPRISLSTVYRNLSLLKDVGLIAERRLGEGHHHYEINVAPHHHHLVCVECGEVFEFESQFTEKMKAAVEEASQYAITNIEINMQGHCRDCLEKSSQ